MGVAQIWIGVDGRCPQCVGQIIPGKLVFSTTDSAPTDFKKGTDEDQCQAIAVPGNRMEDLFLLVPDPSFGEFQACKAA